MAEVLPAQPPRLSTPRLLLEPLEEPHAALAFDAVRDERMYRYVPIDPYRTLEALRERYAHMHAGPSAPDERWWNWAVSIVAERRHVIGTVETSIYENERALLAYGIGPAYWGHGFAYEACAAALEHLRATTNVETVEAYIDTRNVRSIALVGRLGFANVGTLVAADYFKGSASNEYRFRLALR